MSITVHLVSVAPPVLEALRRHPSVLDVVFDCAGQVAAMREQAALIESDHRERFLLFGADPVEVQRFLADPALEDIERCTRGEVRLDKAWAGIHFLLTGEPEPGRRPSTTPLGWAVGGSEAELAGTLHQVAPRVVGQAAVRAVKDALRGIDGDELRRRFDPDALERADVYPDRLWRQDDALDYLVGHFDELAWFYKLAASRLQS